MFARIQNLSYILDLKLKVVSYLSKSLTSPTIFSHKSFALELLEHTLFKYLKKKFVRYKKILQICNFVSNRSADLPYKYHIKYHTFVNCHSTFVIPCCFIRYYFHWNARFYYWPINFQLQANTRFSAALLKD